MAQSSHSLHKTHLPVPINTDSIVERVRGMITFRRSTVASVAADYSATLEAAVVVALVGIATGIGTGATVPATLGGVLAGWVGMAAAISMMANRVLGTPTSREGFMPLLRTIGYAQAPAALALVSFIWGFGPMVNTFAFLWSLMVTIFAVRYTLQFGYARATVLVLAGWVAVNILGLFVTLITGINPQLW
jgi:hypothetical protein